ncbi:isopenicillin N synthase family oxygenase [Leptolyngbya sp. FACHB-261]|uniref:isopenicillin N synthase family dioxygenase n=1 Tax=Leptolyngbya sp. FACHB-261 TaxID=2692806 RepID=UPI00168A3E4F|nr:isopenicillin N synthase family oxygenase [Leptolyngbya sp. FACHB-261]MBD2103508.1 isopenicillin N synthase family oxygenase [Leptolyngbya sp. FACHB-261]
MPNTANLIPLIDFRLFTNGNTTERQAIVAEFYRACHDIGFIYLKNHSVPKPLIEELFAQAKYFFDLETSAKQQIAWSSEVGNRGYVGFGREQLDPGGSTDLKEAFNVGIELDSAQIAEHSQALITNQWPSELPDFRETVLEFYQTCTQASLEILRAFATALDLPETFFDDKHNPGDNTLRLLHYPASAVAADTEQIRAGVHSDYGSITLLFQDEVGGLEVCTTWGEWIRAPYIPDTIVVNTGDLMQRWTNDVFVSTKHRVVSPAGPSALRSRYSVAFFCHPNTDTVVTCLPSCQNSDRPALHPPIQAGEYLSSRLQATY